VRGTGDCVVCKECMLFDDCACTCSVGALFRFFAGSGGKLSQLLLPWSITQEKREKKKRGGPCGHSTFLELALFVVHFV
jgi:hypothetical protein